MGEKVRTLTQEEERLSYVKYFHTPLAPKNMKLIEILNQGPMDPSKALMPENINDLLNPGYLEVETGYCVLSNGAGYVAANNVFPGCTLDMMKWWFAWHPLRPFNYTIWNRECHHSVAITEETRAKILNPNIPLEEKYKDVTHFVVEDIGGGLEDIEIIFLRPEKLGFDMSRFKSPNVAEAFCGYGIQESRSGHGPKAPAVMLHFCRETADGLEFRTRFWMGYKVIRGKIYKVLPPHIKVPIEAAKGLAYHNVEEYSNLAAILPKIYAEMQGKLE